MDRDADKDRTKGIETDFVLYLDLRDSDMWRVVSLYKELFERGESLEDVIRREGIAVRREKMPTGHSGRCVFHENGGCSFLIEESLTEDDYRRAVAHELYHYFYRDDPCDPENPHCFDCNARRFAEFYLIQRHHSMPDIGSLIALMYTIDKGLKSSVSAG